MCTAMSLEANKLKEPGLLYLYRALDTLGNLINGS